MTQVNQDFVMWQGDSKRIIFTVPDIGPTGITAKWQAAPRSTGPPIISKASGEGIALTANGSGLDIVVTIQPEDTLNLTVREYYHECEIMDSDGDVVTVAVGSMDLKRGLIKPGS